MTPASRKAIIVQNCGIRDELPLSPLPFIQQAAESTLLVYVHTLPAVIFASSCGILVPSPSLQATFRIFITIFIIFSIIIIILHFNRLKFPSANRRSTSILHLVLKAMVLFTEKSFCQILISRNTNQMCFLIVLLCKSSPDNTKFKATKAQTWTAWVKK